MDWNTLATQLFPAGFDIAETDNVISGSGQVGGQPIAVIGTCAHIPVGVEATLRQAQFILNTVRDFPRRPILILVDTVGQRLRHRDEMLGINAYMAHLAKCVDFARHQGHTVLGLVYDQALSGGFVCSAMMADACHALPEASIRVMGLPAMARITKVSEERLIALAQENPVFAPGPKNYLAMGGIEAIWQGDLAVELENALASAHPHDQRSALGLARGGRKLAYVVSQEVRDVG